MIDHQSIYLFFFCLFIEDISLRRTIVRSSDILIDFLNISTIQRWCSHVDLIERALSFVVSSSSSFSVSLSRSRTFNQTTTNWFRTRESSRSLNFLNYAKFQSATIWSRIERIFESWIQLLQWQFWQSRRFLRSLNLFQQKQKMTRQTI